MLLVIPEIKIQQQWRTGKIIPSQNNVIWKQHAAYAIPMWLKPLPSVMEALDLGAIVHVVIVRDMYLYVALLTKMLTFFKQILVVIEPLLIDEDYYARVEGREIISNLAKVWIQSI